MLDTGEKVHRRLRGEFAKIYNEAPMGLCYMDTDLRYVHVNDWLANLNGLPAEEHIGRTIRELLPDVAEGVEQQFRRVLETGEPVIQGRVHAETPAHPGIKKHYVHNYYPVKQQDGTIVGLTCAIQLSLKALVANDKSQPPERENGSRRQNRAIRPADDGFIGDSEPLRETLKAIEQVAKTDSTVLILGETGTGKELVAHAIHNRSRRHNRAMVTVNCAALPASLIEAELFGREKGAYTGALTRQTGRFELADGSTIFLDEIGDLSIELQTKLLRVLQEGEFQRLGSSKTQKVDVRVVAATNRSLEKRVRDGEFREDLYYRLNIFPIDVPPLRDRTDDIPQLVWAFIREFQATTGKQVSVVSPETMEAFQQHDWPGNVRELRNIIERLMIMSEGPVLQGMKDHRRGLKVNKSEEKLESLSDVERNHIEAVLESTQWRVRGVGGASEILGLKPTTLEARMRKLGVSRPA